MSGSSCGWGGGGVPTFVFSDPMYPIFLERLVVGVSLPDDPHAAIDSIKPLASGPANLVVIVFPVAVEMESVAWLGVSTGPQFQDEVS